jgi:hypothetical protein
LEGGCRGADTDSYSFQAFADGFKFGQLADKTEVLLSADGSQIMMEWERPYMVRCIDALKIDSNCDVLEIGFGCGYSATRVQYWKPKSHTIVECAPEVLKKLRAWAADKPSVNIVEGTWQSQLPSLALFDAIFFDDFPLGNEENEVEFGKSQDDRYLSTYRRSRSHLHAFMELCLDMHMRIGSKMSGYITHAIKFERADCTITFTNIPVRVHPSCKYFDDNVAVVPLITKTKEKTEEAEQKDCEQGSSNNSSTSAEAEAEAEKKEVEAAVADGRQEEEEAEEEGGGQSTKRQKLGSS